MQTEIDFDERQEGMSETLVLMVLRLDSIVRIDRKSKQKNVCMGANIPDQVSFFKQYQEKKA